MPRLSPKFSVRTSALIVELMRAVYVRISKHRSVDGAGAWMKFEDVLKKSRSCDSVPARTADCDKDLRVPVTRGAAHTYDYGC